MKKRLIALCLALAFVLAALPGNLVSLAADSIGDLVGDEAVGVWGDFSEWVIMEATASFKTDSATLYYNPGTQPNNTVTLTGDDVPASFRVEYMLPLTAADGTVSYWYVLNTEEWAAFAGADACPPYVRVEDVTDLTYLEVQGAADGVSAEFEKVDASTAPEEVDTSHMSGVTSIRGYDISLKDANGATWQPKDNGTTVTVRVYDAWDITVEKPIVDIYHVHGDGTVEVLSNTTGAVTLWPDGSVSFETDSFSNYYIISGYQSAETITLSNGDIIYAVPGETLQFRYTYTWTPKFTGSEPITKSGNTITIAEDAALGDYEYTVRRNSNMNITLKIVSRRDLITQLLKDESMPLILSIAHGIDVIPTEPKDTSDSFIRVDSNYEYAGEYTGYFKKTAAEHILPAVADALIPSIIGDNVSGVADPTGANCLKYLTGIDWTKVLQLAVDRRATAIDGKTANMTDYKIVPYVIKLMEGGSWFVENQGWHVDCAIVPKETVTLAYDLNLANFIVEGKDVIFVPDAKTDSKDQINANGEYYMPATIGFVTYEGKDVLVQSVGVPAKLNGVEYTLYFLGWSLSADSSEIAYMPNDPIQVTEDTVLYAVWSGKPIPGTLKVEKEVETAGDYNAPADVEFEFRVDFTVADDTGALNYKVFNAEGTEIPELAGAIADGGILKLKAGQYALIEKMPIGAVKVEEINIPANFTAEATVIEDEIIGGFTTTAKFTNLYTKPAANLTISKEYPDGADYSIDGIGDTAQMFIFTVTGADNFSMTVAMAAGQSVTIADLPVGTYTVTEQTDWSWRYEPDAASKTVNLSSDATVTFTNTRNTTDKIYWLDGNHSANNLFNGQAPAAGN